jgi:opine dehydrogenase
MAALVRELFGLDCPPATDALQVALANPNPISHGVLALTNLTRIELGESWPQFTMMTPAACRLMEALAAERDALAAAYGHELESLASCLHRANHVPVAPLAEMTARLAALRPDLLGPTTLDSRYVTEDAPYGLGFWLAIAAPKAVPMPATDAMLRLLELAWGRDLRRNPLLDELDLAALPRLLREGAGRD